MPLVGGRSLRTASARRPALAWQGAARALDNAGDVHYVRTCRDTPVPALKMAHAHPISSLGPDCVHASLTALSFLEMKNVPSVIPTKPYRLVTTFPVDFNSATGLGDCAYISSNTMTSTRYATELHKASR